jgi:allantoate deiminase
MTRRITSFDNRLPPEAWQDLGSDIVARLNTLAAISDEPGQLTRLYLGPAHKRTVSLVSKWFETAGFETRVDATGSVVGRYRGRDDEAPILILGSHIDTVRNAGLFDGNLGVITAFTVVERLARAGVRLPFGIEVVAFGDEEGVRFPSALGGSRALAGRFDPRLLDERDADGISRRAALEAFGCQPDLIADEARDPSRVLGYVEVHIEQGPVLESAGLAVGLVTAINGASRGRVVVRGESGHAGTVPMTMRRDALAASAEMVLRLEASARAQTDLVATVGRLEVANGAVNTIPGEVSFTLDIRCPLDAERHTFVEGIKREFDTIAEARHVSAQVELPYDAPAVASDAGLMTRLAAAIERQAPPLRLLPSGAGHDAMAFGGRIPSVMLFVRCCGGISHNPAEFATLEDIDAGARVLLDFVVGLAVNS